jgi:hypothetical protein
MVPVRSAVPGPLYSLDASERKGGSRQPEALHRRGVWGIELLSERSSEASARIVLKLCNPTY